MCPQCVQETVGQRLGSKGEENLILLGEETMECALPPSESWTEKNTGEVPPKTYSGSSWKSCDVKVPGSSGQMAFLANRRRQKSSTLSWETWYWGKNLEQVNKPKGPQQAEKKASVAYQKVLLSLIHKELLEIIKKNINSPEEKSR